MRKIYLKYALISLILFFTCSSEQKIVPKTIINKLEKDTLIIDITSQKNDSIFIGKSANLEKSLIRYVKLINNTDKSLVIDRITTGGGGFYCNTTQKIAYPFVLQPQNYIYVLLSQYPRLGTHHKTFFVFFSKYGQNESYLKQVVCLSIFG